MPAREVSTLRALRVLGLEHNCLKGEHCVPAELAKCQALMWLELKARRTPPPFMFYIHGPLSFQDFMINSLLPPPRQGNYSWGGLLGSGYIETLPHELGPSIDSRASPSV